MVSFAINNTWQEIVPPDSVGTISNENKFRINVAILPSAPTDENYFSYNAYEKIAFNIPTGSKLFVKTNGIFQTGKIRIDEDNLFSAPATAKLLGANGEAIGSFGGAINIHDADVHTSVVNKFMHQHTGIITTLTAPTVGDGTEYQIQIADATGFADGDYLHINTGDVETTHPILLSSSPALPTTGPATFTLDRKLDIAHSIGDEVEKSVVNMATQNGTLASPQEYFVGPQPGEIWHLTRFLFSMVHDLAADAGRFGGIPALTNGVILRVRLNGQYITFTNWKTNSDMELDMYDVRYSARSGGLGAYGTNGRGTITNAGAIIRLDGDTNDRVELYIQDTLVGTGLNVFTMKFQGHFENV